MKLRRGGRVQAVIANCLEARQNFINRRAHNAAASLVAGEIEIQMFAHETIRDACKSIERILDAIPEKFAAKTVVIQRHAQREFHVGFGAAMPEIQIVLPASVEE